MLLLGTITSGRAPTAGFERVRLAANPAKMGQAYARLPLSFEAVPDQSPAEAAVKFRARGPGYNLSLMATQASIGLGIADRGLRIGKLANAAFDNKSAIRNPQSAIPGSRSAIVKMKFAGADPDAVGTGLELLPGESNYLIGNDPAHWRSHVPTFAKIRYAAIYPGIDLIYHGNQQQLEYDFIVAPGADPGAIELEFEGVDEIAVDASGDLVLLTPAGTMRQHKPVIYQEVNGVRKPIGGGFALCNGGVSFEIESYDRSQTLIIDPTLAYSTYLGSSSGGSIEDIFLGDYGFDIAVDVAGNAYITGSTTGSDFPTEKPLQGNYHGGDCGVGPCPDAVVVKLNAAGNALVYATYLGGNDLDNGSSIAVDTSGNAYLTGTTYSSDFPTRNPFQGTLKTVDAFVAKLNPDGSALVYSTFFGGSLIEVGTGIAVDNAGNAAITGITIGSSDLPVEKPLQSSSGGGTCTFEMETLPCPDAFAAKLNAAGNGLVFSTYLGGSSLDLGGGIAMDPGGQVYLTGVTVSSNFPTRNAAQNTFAAGRCSLPLFCVDAFVTKIAADGSAFVYSTYFGGGQPAHNFAEPADYSHGIAADAAGNAYVTGTTGSRDLPIKNALRSTISGFGDDAFVAKFDPAGAMVYSTYLGGSADENFFNLLSSILSLIGFGYSSSSIVVDATGNAYVTGTTDSDDFPSMNGVPQGPGTGSDAFVTKLSPAGALLYSSRLGGSGDDAGYGIAIDQAGSAYLVGITSSGNFPTRNPRQTTLKGENDLFIAKLNPDGPTTTPVATVSAASFSGTQVAPESIAAAFGINLATRTEIANVTPLPTALAGTTVRVRDSAGTERLAPLFFVAPMQINCQVPPNTAAGNATMTITSGDGTVSSGTLRIALTAPGLFAANANGRGVAAAVVLRIRNGVQTFEPVAQFDAAQKQFVAIPIDLGLETDQVFLIPFGTGIRFRSSLAAVTGSVGGTNVPVQYAGDQALLVGVDQINMLLPRSLAGRGPVDVVLTVDGQMTNTVGISVR